MEDNYYLQIAQIPEKRWAKAYWGTLVGKGALKEASILGLSDYLIGKWKYYSLLMAKQNLNFH